MLSMWCVTLVLDRPVDMAIMRGWTVSN